MRNKKGILILLAVFAVCGFASVKLAGGVDNLVSIVKGEGSKKEVYYLVSDFHWSGTYDYTHIYENGDGFSEKYEHNLKSDILDNLSYFLESEQMGNKYHDFYIKNNTLYFNGNNGHPRSYSLTKINDEIYRIDLGEDEDRKVREYIIKMNDSQNEEPRSLYLIAELYDYRDTKINPGLFININLYEGKESEIKE